MLTENRSEVNMEAISDYIRERMSDLSKMSRTEAELHSQMLRECTQGNENAKKYVKEKIKYFLLDRNIPQEIIEDITNEIFAKNYGLGILTQYDDDPAVNEILVNGTEVSIIKEGIVAQTNVNFVSEQEVINIIKRILENSKTDINSANPYKLTYRGNDTRITAVIPPLGFEPYLRIRKFGTVDASEEGFIKRRTINKEMAALLKYLVEGRANILIIGDMGSGKTTMLKYLVGYIPSNQILTVIETSYELYLKKEYPEKIIMSMAEQKELGITMQTLFEIALRTTAQRIICGEARGSEAKQLLEAFTRGHQGSMSTFHAVTPLVAITEVAKLCIEGTNIELGEMERSVANAVDIVLCMRKDLDTGKIKLEKISEIVCDGRDYWENVLMEYDKRADDFIEKNKITDYLKQKMEYFRSA